MGFYPREPGADKNSFVKTLAHLTINYISAIAAQAAASLVKPVIYHFFKIFHINWISICLNCK